MDWTELMAWAGFAATLGAVWRNGWRPAFLRPAPVTPRKAQLFNTIGRLDSVRTITEFPPPAFIASRAGYYVLDTAANGPHYTYRLRADVTRTEAAQ